MAADLEHLRTADADSAARFFADVGPVDLVDAVTSTSDDDLLALVGREEVRQRALCDADAVSFGDYHVAKDIGWALTGTPVDDTELESLLEPYRGHRFRVQVLLGLAGMRRPRRGPRMTLPTHLPSRTPGR